MSKSFARGMGHVTRSHQSNILWFRWNGREDGTARYIPHVRRYSRNGKEHESLAALLRAVEAEHAGA